MNQVPPANRSAANRLIVEDDEDVIEAPPPPSERRTTLKPSATRRPKEFRDRGPYQGRRQVTAHIDETLFKWLKQISAQTDNPMVAIFEEALQAYVQKWASQKKFGQ